MIEAAGLETNDEWISYCTKLVNHMHEVDPDGERFRFPSNTSGVPFQFPRVELDGLAEAHERIVMVCDCAMTALDDRSNHC